MVPVPSAALVSRAEDVRSQLQVQVKRWKKLGDEVAKLLYEVMKGRYYRVYKDKDGNPFTNFEDWAKHDLDIDPRKAYSLKRAWQRLHVEGGLSMEEMKQIPWTKADVIAAEASPDNAQELAEKAKTLNITDLRKEVKKIRHHRKQLEEGAKDETSDSAKEETFDRFFFYLTPSQKEVIDQALARAGRVAESDSEGVALTGICTEWLTFNADSSERLDQIIGRLSLCFKHHEIVAFRKDDASALPEILQAIEELFDVSLEVHDAVEEP